MVVRSCRAPESAIKATFMYVYTLGATIKNLTYCGFLSSNFICVLNICRFDGAKSDEILKKCLNNDDSFWPFNLSDESNFLESRFVGILSEADRGSHQVSDFLGPFLKCTRCQVYIYHFVCTRVISKVRSPARQFPWKLR